MPGLTVAPGDVLRVRFELSGTSSTTARAKVWRASTAEPGTWLVTGTEATPVRCRHPATWGCRFYTSGSWAGAAPVLTIDNLDVGPVGP